MLADSSLVIPGELIPLVAIVGGLLIPLAGIVCYYWQLARQTELEIGLKQDMVNRGMSAEEIERVLRATSKTDKTCSSEKASRLE